MTQILRPSGVIVDTTGGVKLSSETISRAKRGSRRGAAKGLLLNDDVIVSAMIDQEFVLVDAVPLKIPPVPPSRKRRGASTAPSNVSLDVPLGPDEYAVVLLEEEGVYRWIVESKTSPQESTTRKRGRRGVARSARRVQFSIDIEPGPSVPPGVAKRSRGRRGWISEKLVGKVTAYVFRFVLKKFGGRLVKFLERKLEKGLRAVVSPDPDRWSLLGDNERLPFKLPIDGQPRVLLLVHGTFSSTLGTFGALGITEDGRDFLARALQNYDAVLGFDHPTLSVDPKKNATDLLGRLQSVNWSRPPYIDIVAFSRGGLITRTLIEQLLPSSDWDPTIGRVIFVGCTNAGTQLAEPENWNRFVDRYTNLALGAARVLSLIPGSQVWTGIASAAIRGVGTLIKGLATGAVTDNFAPGLAAMEPDGNFVTELDATIRERPQEVPTEYFAITTNFDPDKALMDGANTALPPKLLLRIADWSADKLYEEANDLVVHVDSMTRIDPDVGGLVAKKHEFGTNGIVYHTNYFAQAATAIRLSEWFELPEVDGVQEKRVKRQKVTKSYSEILGSAASKRYSYGRSLPPPPPPPRALPGNKRRTPKVADKTGGNAGARDTHGPRRIAGRRSVRGKRKATLKLARRSDGRKGGVGAAPKKELEATSEGAAAAPEKVVGCHFLAEIEQVVELEVPAALEVTIAREALKMTPGREGTVKKTGVQIGRKLIVEVTECRNFRVAGPRRQEVDVPETDEPEYLYFTVVGLRAGVRGELSVQVRQGSVPLVTLDLKPYIERRGAHTMLRAPGELGKLSSLKVRGRIAELPPTQAPLDELRIIERLVGTEVSYLFLLDLHSLGIREEYESQPLPGARDNYIQQILNEIGDSWAADGKDGLESFERNLRSIGGKMFDQLFPRQMQEMLWKERAHIHAIQVFSREPFVPWELVYLKNPHERVVPNDSCFFGEMGLLRWIYKGYPPTKLRIRKDRARYVIPHYGKGLVLEQTDAEIKLLSDVFSATPVGSRLNDLEKLLGSPGLFDLLHFGGHGEAAGTESSQARLLIGGKMVGGIFEGEALTATTVDQTADLRADDNQPVVVLNACESARRNREFAGMGGFADAFVKAGAGAFIGTHWSVGDGPAHVFVEAFYRAIGGAPRKIVRLSDAVSKARQAARDDGDATWLAYVVYGHPNAAVSVE